MLFLYHSISASKKCSDFIEKDALVSEYKDWNFSKLMQCVSLAQYPVNACNDLTVAAAVTVPAMRQEGNRLPDAKFCVSVLGKAMSSE